MKAVKRVLFDDIAIGDHFTIAPIPTVDRTTNRFRHISMKVEEAVLLNRSLGPYNVIRPYVGTVRTMSPEYVVYLVDYIEEHEG